MVRPVLGRAQEIHQEVLRAEVPETHRLGGVRPQPPDEHLLARQGVLEHDAHREHPLRLEREPGAPLLRRGRGERHAAECGDALGEEIRGQQRPFRLLVEEQVQVAELRAGHDPVVFLVQVVQRVGAREILVERFHEGGRRLAREAERVLLHLVERLNRFRHHDGVFPSECPSGTQMVEEPGFQLAGQRSPVCSAWRTRTVSSTLRPTLRLWITACCTTPFGSMMNRPRSAIPLSSRSTP